MLSCEISEPHPPEALNCPRCDSPETKFCYYNNYSATQPRHFCKNCKRYWTAGGSLRNVPVGGGLRKNKKPNQVKASSDGFANDESQTLANSLFLASPSSSADGAIDETLANPSASLLAYPSPAKFMYFDSTAENHYTGDYATSGVDLPHFNYMDARNFSHFYGGHGHTLPVEGLEQQKDAAYGGCKRRRGLGVSDLAQSNSGEIAEVASEPSQANSEALKDPQLGPSAGLYQRHNGRHRYHERGQQANGAEAMVIATSWHQSFHETEHPQGQGKLQSSTEELMLLQDSKSRDRSAMEDDDEGLGNVINVRYPYDWEQVSEVLFGGTPDFFHMPGF